MAHSAVILNRLQKCAPSTCSFHKSSLLRESKEPPKRGLELSQDNFVTKIYKKVYGNNLPKSRLKASGYILESQSSQMTDLAAFIETFHMPDTFYTWFLVTELHVWLLGVRIQILAS